MRLGLGLTPTKGHKPQKLAHVPAQLPVRLMGSPGSLEIARCAEPD